MGSKTTCISWEDPLNNEQWTDENFQMGRNVVLDAPDKVKIHCLMHDTCQIDVRMTYNMI